MFAVFLALGYFIGSAFPINGNSAILPPGQTTIATGTSGGQQQGSGTVRLQLSPDDDPTIGDLNAPIQFYEFSDFQCPFCRRFFTESLPQIQNEYVKTGKVLYVYKDFPLDQIHPAATPAAVYANCANEQGKWLEFHDKIFEEQNKFGAGTVNFGIQELDRWVSETDLNTQEISSCVNSGKYLEEIQADQQEGLQAGVSGTPTFYIGNSEIGFVQVVGAQPFTVLKQVIEEQLSKA